MKTSMKISLTTSLVAGTICGCNAFCPPPSQPLKTFLAADVDDSFDYGAFVENGEGESENASVENSAAEEQPEEKVWAIPQMDKKELKRVAPFATLNAEKNFYNGPNLAYANEPGVVAPLGLFDPISLLDDADQERFDRLRSVELKHGRASMLAVVGYLVTYAGYRLPGLEDVPAGLAALDKLPNDVVGQIWMTFFLMEIANRDQTGEAEFPGDFRNGVIDFGWDEQTDDWKFRKRSIELQNGRAAMMGILALMVHDGMGNVADIIPK